MKPGLPEALKVANHPPPGHESDCARGRTIEIVTNRRLPTLSRPQAHCWPCPTDARETPTQTETTETIQTEFLPHPTPKQKTNKNAPTTKKTKRNRKSKKC